MAGMNYAAGTPNGSNGTPIYGAPAPYKAIARYYAAAGATSSVITLTENTTAIEIAAHGTPAIMRWVSVADGAGANSSVISTNYDHVIPAGTVRRFVVPIEATVGVNSVMGANRENGLYRRVAYKSEGVGSVFASEYGSSNAY